MPRVDQASADCFVFTFKEGLLSAIAHDLKLRVNRFTIDVDKAKGTIAAEFAADSLRVLHAMHDAREDGAALSDADRRKIEHNIAEDVLDTKRHPTIRFTGSSITPAEGGFDVAGELALHGQRRPLRVRVSKVDQRLVAQVTLHQPDFGIKPYTAMLGTLRIRPDVRVEISLPSALFDGAA